MAKQKESAAVKAIGRKKDNSVRTIRILAFLIPVIAVSAAFAMIMIAAREQMYVNIVVTVIYVYTIFLMLFRYSRRGGAPEGSGGEGPGKDQERSTKEAL